MFSRLGKTAVSTSISPDTWNKNSIFEASSVNEVFRMKAEHFSFKMKVLAIWKLAKQSQKTPFCSGEQTFHGYYLRCLLRSKVSAAQKREGNVWYFQRNCFIFKVKVLKEVRFSESLLILLEIWFVWNNGGQKHSLSFDVMCPVSGQFFVAGQNRWISGVHSPDKIYFISVTIIKA